MENLPVLVIKYNPINRNVSFHVRSGDGVCTELDDSEPLKEYENEPGIFSLEGLHDKLFSYIKENFDGEEKAAIEIVVSKEGLEQKRAEFQRFKEAVAKFNRENEMQLVLEFREADSNADAVSLDAESFAGESGAQECREKIKIAVIGKMGSGKTELIRGMNVYLGSACVAEPYQGGAVRYADRKNNTEWYEAAGIDTNENAARRTVRLLEQLVREGVSVVLYCVNGMLRRFGSDEKKFLRDMMHQFPGLKICIVITLCEDEEAAQELADAIWASENYADTYTVLARQKRTRAGYVEAFGMDKLAESIYGE